MDEIYSSLRITTSLNDLFRAVYKEFNFTENYPKGHGEMLMEWMRINHPDSYLMPTMIELGGYIQDICWGRATSVFINHGY